MTNRTLVYYVIPEDDDDFEHPNVFAVHKGVKQLTIRDVVDAFPLPGKERCVMQVTTIEVKSTENNHNRQRRCVRILHIFLHLLHHG